MTIEHVLTLLKALHNGESVWAKTNAVEAADEGGWEPIDGIEVTVSEEFILLHVEVAGQMCEIEDVENIVVGHKNVLLARADSLYEKAHYLRTQAEALEEKASE